MVAAVDYAKVGGNTFKVKEKFVLVLKIAIGNTQAYLF